MANRYLEAMQGEEEVLWSTRIYTLHTLFQSNRRVMEVVMWSEVIDHLIYTWPYTLLEKLPWGPEPHLGLQGGLSGWGLDLALDRLDYLVAEVARLAGTTEWTNIALSTLYVLPGGGDDPPQHKAVKQIFVITMGEGEGGSPPPPPSGHVAN